MIETYLIALLFCSILILLFGTKHTKKLKPWQLILLIILSPFLVIREIVIIIYEQLIKQKR